MENKNFNLSFGKNGWYEVSAYKRENGNWEIGWGSYGSVDLETAEKYAKLIIEAVKKAKEAQEK